jgi:hypothetical protein
MMKKAVYLALALTCAAVLVGCGGGGSGGGGKVAAATDFSFDLTSDGEGVVITGYSGKGGKVVIPAEIEGYPVVSIAGDAFAAEWTERTLDGAAGYQKYLAAAAAYARAHPNSPNSGRDYPKTTDPEFFVWVETKHENPAALSITEVTIPESITEIGGRGFINCKNLVSVTVQGSVTFSSGTFSGCNKVSIATRQALKEAGYTGNF